MLVGTPTEPYACHCPRCQPDSLPGILVPRWAARGRAGGGWQEEDGRARWHSYGEDSPCQHPWPVGHCASSCSIQTLCWQAVAPVHTLGLEGGQPCASTCRAGGPCSQPWHPWPAGMALGTQGVQTRLGDGNASPRDCWVPKQPGGFLWVPQGSSALQSTAPQPLVPRCMDNLHRCNGEPSYTPTSASMEHHGAPYSCRTGCQGTLQCLLPHGGERIPHADLG